MSCLAAPPLDPRGGRANTNVGHGSEVPSGAARVYAAPQPQLGLPSPLRVAARRSVKPGLFEQPLDRSVERVLLNIFIVIAILGMALRSVSASCQRRQLWSRFGRLFWLDFYFAAEHASKQEVVSASGRKLRIWNTVTYLYTLTY